MRLHLWGIDYHREHHDLRRQLFFPKEERARLFEKARAAGLSDLIYLPTCNRVEFYTTASSPFVDLRTHWSRFLESLSLPENTYHFGYHLEGKAAVRHLMRVAASLESLVVGEPQILGQLKDALAEAEQWGSKCVPRMVPAPSTHRCFQVAFETAKRVRTETAMAEKPVSVATLALNYLKKDPAAIDQVVVVGRSPITRAILQHFIDKDPSTPITWVNRDVGKLEDYAEFSHIKKIPLSDFLGQPPSFSHLFTATSSREEIFDFSFWERVQASCLVFDLAEPYDVSEKVPQGVRVVRLEDFQQQAKENVLFRKRAVGQANQIIEENLKLYCQQQKEAPVLKQFGTVEEKFFSELQFQLGQLDLPTGDDKQKVRDWAETLLKKNLHHSRDHLKDILRQFSEPSDPNLIL